MKLWIFLCLSWVLTSIVSGAPKQRIQKRAKELLNENETFDLQSNLTALWEKVNSMSSGVQIHLHGMHDAKPHLDEEDDGTHVHLHMHMHDEEDDEHDHENHRMDVNESGYHYGICRVVPNSASPTDKHQSISGNLYFRQMHGKHLEVKVHLEGFDVSEGESPVHGLHVHQYGDMSEGCQSMGGHFSPENQKHGGPMDENRHCGDYGNIECDDEGVVHKTFYDDHTALIGHYSIVGRGVVIHENLDNLGSDINPSGGAGDRIACCVVVESPELDWDTIHGEHEETIVVDDHRHEGMGHHGHDKHHDHHGHHGMHGRDRDHHDHRGHKGHDHHDHHENLPEDHDPNHPGHENHEGHAHEDHPHLPGHENHEGHVHPKEHDPNHPGHENHFGHEHENHPEHPGHENHEGHVHPEDILEGTKLGKKKGKGKRKNKRNKKNS